MLLSSDRVGVVVANFDNHLVVDYNRNVADNKICERDLISEAVAGGLPLCAWSQ